MVLYPALSKAVSHPYRLADIGSGIHRSCKVRRTRRPYQGHMSVDLASSVAEWSAVEVLYNYIQAAVHRRVSCCLLSLEYWLEQYTGVEAVGVYSRPSAR